MSTHRITLHGPAVARDRLAARVLRHALEAVDEGAQSGVRLRVEGRSLVSGPRPDWLDAACRFDYLLPDDAHVVELFAPSLAEAVPDRFAQGSFFLDTSRSCLSLWQESLADALAGRADSDGFDANFLKVVAGRFDRLFREGVDQVEIANGSPTSPSLTIVPDDIRRVRRLQKRTPAPQAARVSGTLDAIRHSDRMFALVLPSGETLRGVAEDAILARLPDLWGKAVAATGRAVFRPSGDFLRLDAEHIEPARPADLAIFAKRPEPIGRPIDARKRLQPQGPDSGLNAIFGRWPGDETDEEVAAMLEDLS
jgi:hypothetical protein